MQMAMAAVWLAELCDFHCSVCMGNRNGRPALGFNCGCLQPPGGRRVCRDDPEMAADIETMTWRKSGNGR
jgi:hypothetical protein